MTMRLAPWIFVPIFVAAPALAADRDGSKPITLRIAPGQLVKLPLLAPATRVLVSDPTVASVLLGVEPEQIVVRGLARGTTMVTATSEDNRQVGLYNLTVAGAGEPTAGIAAKPTEPAVSYPLTLQFPEAQTVDLPHSAASIVIDDETIAGAQITPDSKLIVFSKAAGSTLIHALGADGNPVAIVRLTVAGAVGP